MDQAKKAISKRDMEDADYIACGLAIKADFIWTNDKDFKIQKIIPAKTTKKFLEEGKLS